MILHSQLRQQAILHCFLVWIPWLMLAGIATSYFHAGLVLCQKGWFLPKVREAEAIRYNFTRYCISQPRLAPMVVSLQPAANSHHLKTEYNTLISALV